jgi:hypothetical protein
MRAMGASENSAWLQWKAAAGWSPDHREIDPPPPRIVQIAEEALYSLRGVLRNAVENGALSEIDELSACNDLEQVDIALTYLKQVPAPA